MVQDAASDPLPGPEFISLVHRYITQLMADLGHHRIGAFSTVNDSTRRCGVGCSVEADEVPIQRFRRITLDPSTRDFSVGYEAADDEVMRRVNP